VITIRLCVPSADPSEGRAHVAKTLQVAASRRVPSQLRQSFVHVQSFHLFSSTLLVKFPEIHTTSEMRLSHRKFYPDSTHGVSIYFLINGNDDVDVKITALIYFTHKCLRQLRYHDRHRGVASESFKLHMYGHFT
jgi:hypothetical protein